MDFTYIDLRLHIDRWLGMFGHNLCFSHAAGGWERERERKTQRRREGGREREREKDTETEGGREREREREREGCLLQRWISEPNSWIRGYVFRVHPCSDTICHVPVHRLNHHGPLLWLQAQARTKPEGFARVCLTWHKRTIYGWAKIVRSIPLNLEEFKAREASNRPLGYKNPGP